MHKHVLQSGFWNNVYVQSSLISFYVKCEEVKMGEKVFDEMPERNVVAWSAMIGGYSRLGMGNEALGLFREMQKAGWWRMRLLWCVWFRLVLCVVRWSWEDGCTIILIRIGY